jgi:hypothetical protein
MVMKETADDQKRDEVLKRMLSTPPKPKCDKPPIKNETHEKPNGAPVKR